MNADIARLAQALQHAARAGTPIDLEAAQDKLWVLALERVVASNDLTAAGYAARALALAFPDARYFSTIHTLLETLPDRTGDAGFDAFHDDPALELQFARRDDSDAVVLAFCGIQHRLGMPMNFAHRWLGLLNADIVYLRDHRRKAFSSGIGSLGSNYRDTIVALRALLAAHGTKRIFGYGNSFGGYGALRYGFDLGAEAVLTFGAPTDISPETDNPRLGQYGVTGDLDLATFYRSASAPRGHLVYAADHPEDARQANRLAGAPTITVEAIAGGRYHNVVVDCVAAGRYAPLLAWLRDPHRT